MYTKRLFNINKIRITVYHIRNIIGILYIEINVLQFKINNLKEDNYNNYWKTGGPVHRNYTESV